MIEYIRGTSGNDFLSDVVPNELDPLRVDSFMWGGAGDDTFRSANGNDRLFGGFGDDNFLIVNTNNVRVTGGKGQDELTIYVETFADIARVTDHRVVMDDGQVIRFFGVEQVNFTTDQEYHIL